MHPHVIAWWARRRHLEDVYHAHEGHGRHHDRQDPCHTAPHGPEGGGFGVRRPLRFLSHKLDLNDKQASAVARILDELKTERAQIEVDERRTASAFAAAFEKPEFDAQAATNAAERRVDSAKRLRDAVIKALADIHALLNDEQRETFAYLIRTGVLSI